MRSEVLPELDGGAVDGTTVTVLVGAGALGALVAWVPGLVEVVAKVLG
jgi:hypothetical protein